MPTIRTLLIAVLLLGIPVVPATAEESPDLGPYWQFVAGHDNDALRDSDNSATLSWGTAYRLRVFLSAYQLSEEPYWLGRIADYADSILANAQDVPDIEGVHPIYADGFRGWGTSIYSDEPYDEFMVHDGHFCTPIAAYIAEVYQNPEELWDEYGERAAAHFDTLAKHVAGKWIASWDADRGTGITLRDFGGFRHMPHNQYHTFASFLVFMNDVVNTPKWAELNDYSLGELPDTYRPYIVEMGQFMKDDLRRNQEHDSYHWGYWPGGASEDISHSNLTMEFIWYLYERGIVFDDTDMRRFANTMSRRMWNGDFANVGIHKYNTSGVDYEWTSRVWGWAYFVEADPLLFHIYHNYFRHRTSIGSSYELTAALRTWRHAQQIAESAGAIIAPVSLVVEDDGDRVIRPGEDANLAATFRNYGIAAVDGFAYSIAGTELSMGADSLGPGETYTGRLTSPDIDAALDGSAAVQVPVWAEVAWIPPGDRPHETWRIERKFPVYVGDLGFLYVSNAPVTDVLADQEIERYLPKGSAEWLRIEADTLTSVPLENFTTLFWRAAWAVPTAGERDAIAAFLDGGGKLVLTGGDGSLTTWFNRSAEDSLFFARYLRITDIVNLREEIEGMRVRCQPVNATAFTGMGNRRRDIGRATDAPRFGVEVMRFENLPDSLTMVIEVTDLPTIPYLTAGAGIDSTYDAIVFGWDFGQLTLPTHIIPVMEAAFDWVEQPTSILHPALPEAADPLRINAHPNPFNPATSLTVTGLIPGRPFIIRIVAANGQTVRTIRSTADASSAGLVWDGLDASGRPAGSGVYAVAAEQRDETDGVRRHAIKLTLTR